MTKARGEEIAKKRAESGQTRSPRGGFFAAVTVSLTVHD
jgi:hypothetical protein